MNAPILVKGTIEYAEWLADKLHCTNDYGKEAAELLVQQAKKLVTKATFEASRMRLFARATGHPMVLEIMADCADAIDTENSAQHDTDVGPYDGSQWVALAAELRQRAAAIRAEDPDIWTTNDKLPQGEPVAWMHKDRSLLAFRPFKDFTIPLYEASKGVAGKSESIANQTKDVPPL